MGAPCEHRDARRRGMSARAIMFFRRRSEDRRDRWQSTSFESHELKAAAHIRPCDTLDDEAGAEPRE